ncbi:hypothetical protein V1478_016505 [Vespula squamosa]|uniref:Uncharacterized protein n=1 Tax=Vespula squamosa TaxID=30214 RepID=A0ABD2A022_VESSQ
MYLGIQIGLNIHIENNYIFIDFFENNEIQELQKSCSDIRTAVTLHDDKYLFFSKGQDGYTVVVSGKAPVILHSTYQLFNGSKKYTNYLLTI